MHLPAWRALVTLCVHALVAVNARAEAESAAGSRYDVRTWQTEDGLPRNTITCIAQSADGYLWLGTPFGVFRFDGLSFTRLDKRGAASLGRQRTRALYLDRAGRMWGGTGTAGVVRYDQNDVRVFDSRDGLPTPTITALCEDPQGGMWLGTEHNPCWLDAQDQVHRIEGPALDPTQLVRDVWGRVWFAGRHGYGQLTHGGATNVTSTPNPAVLCTRRKEGLWVSDQTCLKRIGPPGSAAEAAPILLPSGLEVRALLEDWRGDLWLGTDGQGLYRYAQGQFFLELPSTRRMLALFEDSEFNLWVGTDGGGLSRLKPKVFQTVDTSRGLALSLVHSVCEDAGGVMWLAPQRTGLAHWTGAGPVEFLPELSSFGITAVLPNPVGGVWVGSVNQGLYLAKDGQVQRLTSQGPFHARQIRVLHQDGRGDLWLGCLPDGLAKWSGNQLTPPQVFEQQGAPAGAIWAIADDGHGTLWLGTIKGELWSYDGQRFRQFGATEGLPGAPLGALHFDSAGALWLGTLGAGLGRYHHGQFVFADVRHGLDDEVIAAILEDGRGYFWLASERGISRVRQHDLNEFMEGRCSQFESTLFGKNEGLDNVNSSGGFQPAAWRTRAGTLWFATSRGAVGVDPASLRGSPQGPSLVLEGIWVDGVEVPRQTSLQLPHNYRELEFRYSAPSFAAPERVRFRRQLVGLDPDWQATTTARVATYSPLAPGHYEFRFTACNSEGIWNQTPASVSFVVAPAFWQTAWFRGLVLLACMAALAGGVRYRYAQQMRRQLRQFEQAHAIEQERMRIARDIHDDLGARLTQMALLSEMAAGEIGTQGKAGERLAKVARSSREAVRALEETVWAINPHKDSLHDLVDYLSHYANEFFRPTPARCRQDLPLLIPEVQLPAEVRHNLFLACKEALNNVQKHAQATEVWLRLTVADSRLDLLIEDNGLGFPVQPRSGNGLQNMQARLAAIAGECRVDSQPGRGTRVCFSLALPWPPAAESRPPANGEPPSPPTAST